MGPMLVLVSPCFRENVNVTSKIVSFLCNLDNYLLKNWLFCLIVIKFQNGAQLKKRAIFDLLFTFLVTREKTQKFLQHIIIPLTYTYFAHPLTFCLPNFAKIANLSCMVSLWCDSWCWFFFAPFWSNQWITKWWEKFRVECLLLICVYTNGKFVVICRPRTLNDVRWRLSSIQKAQKKSVTVS